MSSAERIPEVQGRRGRRRNDETAFLPAALEIIETAPSPLGRGIGVTIIALFCSALAWAWLGSADIIAVAPGRVIPNGRSKIIQPFETGVVRAVKVRDGATVKSGDVLIELDPTISAAEVEHVKSDLMNAELDAARLRAALSGASDPAERFTPPAGAGEAQVKVQRQVLATQSAEHNAKLAEIDRQVAQKKAEQNTIAATIARLEATAPPLEERVNVRQYLYDRKIGSRLTYLTEYQDLVGQKHDLLIQRSRQQEIDAAIAVVTETRAKVEAEYRRGLAEDLAKAEQKAAGLAQDVVKAERRARFQVLTAPIDGVVQQLAVHTIGGVVTAAQILAVVVPLDSDLEIEAMVSNSDIGFVLAGQKAEIKVDAFNFTRYGLLHGRVAGVSNDAVSHDDRDEPSRSASVGARAPSDAHGLQLAYAARVVLDRAHMQVENRSAPLLAGMAVTVEIKTGSRRIIDYLLSPLARYRQEIMRER